MKHQPLWLHKDKAYLIDMLQAKLLQETGVKLAKNELVEKIIEIIINNNNVYDMIKKEIIK